MATKRPEAHSFLVRFAEVAWFKELNLARESGDYGDEGQLKTLRTQLTRDCWWKDMNGHVAADNMKKDFQIEIDGKLVNAIEYELERRKRTWQDLKSKPAAKAVDVTTFERLFMENGKFIVPKYLGITGNRRASQFVDAMIARAKLTDDDPKSPTYGKPLEIDDTLAVIVADYSDPLVRLEAQCKENVLKTAGFLNSSPLDQLLMAKRMMSLGASQVRLRNQFNATNGVKYYYMVLFDSMYPKIRILERCKLDPTNPDAISIPKIRHADLQDMGQRQTPEDTEIQNRKLMSKGQAAKGLLTEAEVTAYFANPAANGKADDRAMDKNGIDAISKVHENPIVKRAAAAIRANRGDMLDGVYKHISKGCEFLVTLAEQQDYVLVEKVLDKLVQLPQGEQRVKAEKDLLKTLGVKV